MIIIIIIIMIPKLTMMTQYFFGYNHSDDDYGSGKTVQRPYPPASSMCGRYLENNPKVYWQRPQTRGHGPRWPGDMGLQWTSASKEPYTTLTTNWWFIGEDLQ